MTLIQCASRLNTAGLNGTSQRSKMLYDRWVLDVPKLLDLTAIYGPDNAGLVQQLMQQVPESPLTTTLFCLAFS